MRPICLLCQFAIKSYLLGKTIKTASLKKSNQYPLKHWNLPIVITENIKCKLYLCRKRFSLYIHGYIFERQVKKTQEMEKAKEKDLWQEEWITIYVFFFQSTLNRASPGNCNRHCLIIHLHFRCSGQVQEGAVVMAAKQARQSLQTSMSYLGSTQTDAIWRGSTTLGWQILVAGPSRAGTTNCNSTSM